VQVGDALGQALGEERDVPRAVFGSAFALGFGRFDLLQAMIIIISSIVVEMVST
jgi:hypothetical protein